VQTVVDVGVGADGAQGGDGALHRPQQQAGLGLSAIGTDTHVDHRLHVVLPGSPNRGTFGGDGAYGEVKSALDAIVNRWSSERAWAQRVTLAHPRIGWVKGTGPLGGDDPAGPAAGGHPGVLTQGHQVDVVTQSPREVGVHRGLSRLGAHLGGAQARPTPPPPSGAR